MNPIDYQKAVQALFSNSQTAPFPPPFTAFSSASRVEVLVKDKSPYDVLDKFAEKMLVYRSWGRGGDLNGGLRSERNFQDDHDWYRDMFWSNETRHFEIG